MGSLRHLFERLGLAEEQTVNPHEELMQQALRHLRMAEIQIREAANLEQLDLGRTALQQALAEVQHVVRQAKKEQGMPLRSIAETEEMHQRLMLQLASRRNKQRRTERPQAG